MMASSIRRESKHLNLKEAQSLLLSALADPGLSVDALSIYRDWLERRLAGALSSKPNEIAANMGMSPAAFASGRKELLSLGYIGEGDLA